MNNVRERSEGKAEELGGKIKQGLGKLLGNEQMEAEGAAKAVKGEARQEVAKGAERVKGKVEEVVGAVKNRVGHVIDNEQMEAEGKVKEIQGEVRQKSNKQITLRYSGCRDEAWLLTATRLVSFCNVGATMFGLKLRLNHTARNVLVHAEQQVLCEPDPEQLLPSFQGHK